MFNEREQYKDILNKQKEIMIALRNKLNERDELIANLEEQILLFDNQDDVLSNYYKRINQLEALLIKNKIPLPENLNPNNFNDFNFTMLNLQYEMNNNNNNEKSKIRNWKTMLVMINYVHESFSESLSTLCFAQRDKKIKNRFVINEDLNNRALFKQFELELRNFKK